MLLSTLVETAILEFKLEINTVLVDFNSSRVHVSAPLKSPKYLYSPQNPLEPGTA